MPKRVIAYVPAVAAGLCTVMAFSTNWALAAGNCVGQPNRQSAQDGHWYYRVDRVSQRQRSKTRAEGRTAGIAALMRSATLIRAEQTPFAMRQLTMANRRFGSKPENLRVKRGRDGHC